jgi:hypothetical protein
VACSGPSAVVARKASSPRADASPLRVYHRARTRAGAVRARGSGRTGDKRW